MSVRPILVVDDSPLIRSGMTSILESLGQTAQSAESAEAALVLVEGGLQPRAVFTDYNMGGMTGIDLVARLRARPEFARVPIFLLTTETKKHMRAAAKSAGASGWLVKPLEMAQMTTILEAIAAREEASDQ